MDPFRSSLASFETRGTYLDLIKRLSSCDNYTSISENPYYGKVNSNGDIVYLSEKYLAPLPTKEKKAIYALNFVVDAFSDFKNYYLKAINTGIVKDDILREVINPVKGWQSVHELYANNINSLYYTLINSYLQREDRTKQAKPGDFDEFINALNTLFSAAGKNVKLSRSSFILSSACPISTTGLVIELAPKNETNRTSKQAIAFFTSTNYDFYLRALKKYGFMVDINYPSRIIADIGSPAMQGYMNKYDLTMESLFNNYFYKAKDYDYDLIKVYLTQFYNNYVGDYPLEQNVVKAGRVSSQKYSLENVGGIRSIPVSTLKVVCEKTLKDVIRRQKLTQEQMDRLYNDAYWISYYPQMMNFEMDNALNNHRIKKVVKNSQDLHKTLGIDAAKSYVSNIFKTLRFPVGSKVSTTLQTTTVLTSTTSSDTIGPSTSGGYTSGGSTSGGSSGGGGGY
jgi:hypothetical protein